MPSNRHLEVVEITDFAPGLYEKSEWLIPADGWQTMQDCYPQRGGGLRAFYKAVSIGTTGIADTSIERVIGLHARGGIPDRGGSPGDGTDRYLMTYSFDSGATAGQKALPKLYRIDGSNAETDWTQIFVTSGTTEFNFATDDNNSPNKVNFRFFRLSAGSPNDQYVIFSILYVASTTRGPGFYRLNYNDGSSSQKAIELTTSVTGKTRPDGPLAVHQARVLIAGGNDEYVIYSDPGTVTFGADNFERIEPNQDLPVIIGMHALPPSDFLVMKEGAPFVNIQGDITDPVIQQLSEGVAPGGSGKQDFGRHPNGMTFIATDGGVYLTGGHNHQLLSAQLEGFRQQDDFVGPGDTNFLGGFLFCPNGYVYDFETGSWFTQTQIAGALHNVQGYDREIWGPSGTDTLDGHDIVRLEPFEHTDRVSTYTAKTAPLRSPDGRQIEIREVELILKNYEADSTVDVTVNGTTVQQTLSGTGRQDVSFLFRERSEVLDVQVVPAAASASEEAPSIEAMRIYTNSGHQTY